MYKCFISQEQKNSLRSYLPNYLKDVYNIDTPINGQSININCLVHNDRHPSANYNPSTCTIHCYSCGETYDIFTLYAMNNELDVKKDFIKIANDLIDIYCNGDNSKLNKVTIAQYKPIKEKATINYLDYYNKCNENYNALGIDYLQKRGICLQLMNKFNIGYDTDKKLLIMPIDNYHYIERNINTTKKERFLKVVPSMELFGKKYIEDNYYTVFVCEGIIDALSLYQVDWDFSLNAIYIVSLNSTNNKNKLLDLINKSKFNGRIIFALDNDKSGYETTEFLIKELSKLKHKLAFQNLNWDILKFSNIEGEDINDVLCNNSTYLAKQVSKYLPLKNQDEYLNLIDTLYNN